MDMQTEMMVVNKFISKRIKSANINYTSGISFDEFSDLLDFDKQDGLTVYLEYSKNNQRYSNESFLLSKLNFLKDKKAVKANKIIEKKSDSNQEPKEQIEEKEDIKVGEQSPKDVLDNKETLDERKDGKLDFSMFDALLEEFDIKDKKTKKRVFKHDKENYRKIINYFKKEIRYYEKKIDTIYKLDNLEIEEKNLFALRERLNKLKEDYELLEQNVLVAEKFESLMKTCQKEIVSLEKIIQNNDLKQINDEFNFDLKQGEFEKLIKSMSAKVNSNICFNMLKRMMFNLYKMSVGMYTIEISKDDYKKLVYGSFLVVNSVIGIREAISLKFNKNRYYNQNDYNNLSNDELLELSDELLKQTIINIDELKQEFKVNFSTYKKYTNEYEEVYFKIIRVKKILDKKKEQLKELIEA